MDYFTAACLLFSSAGAMSFMVFRRPMWTWSQASAGPGLVVPLVAVPADWFSLAALIYTHGWWWGFGYWSGAAIAGILVAKARDVTRP